MTKKQLVQLIREGLDLDHDVLEIYELTKHGGMWYTDNAESMTEITPAIDSYLNYFKNNALYMRNNLPAQLYRFVCVNKQAAEHILAHGYTLQDRYESFSKDRNVDIHCNVSGEIRLMITLQTNTLGNTKIFDISAYDADPEGILELQGGELSDYQWEQEVLIRGPLTIKHVELADV